MGRGRPPGFKRSIDTAGLPFKPYEHICAADIDERSDLYRQIAKQVWNPKDLLTTAAATS